MALHLFSEAFRTSVGPLTPNAGGPKNGGYPKMDGLWMENPKNTTWLNGWFRGTPIFLGNLQMWNLRILREKTDLQTNILLSCVWFKDCVQRKFVPFKGLPSPSVGIGNCSLATLFFAGQWNTIPHINPITSPFLRVKSPFSHAWWDICWPTIPGNSRTTVAWLKKTCAFNRAKRAAQLREQNRRGGDSPGYLWANRNWQIWGFP